MSRTLLLNMNSKNGNQNLLSHTHTVENENKITKHPVILHEILKEITHNYLHILQEIG